MHILVDYLTMTSKIHSVQNFIDILGLQSVTFRTEKSKLPSYNTCLIYDGIKIHWRIKEDITEVCVDLSGKGCRTLEFLNNCEFDWFNFFLDFKEDFESRDCHISRLDIACDDFGGILNMPVLERYTRERKFVCKSKCEPWGTWGRKIEIYHGSEKSDRFIRIYDKALEQGYPEGIAHWIRCEFQFRNECAMSFLLNWYNIKDIGVCYSGVVNDYLRYVTKSTLDMTGQNYSRLITCGFWHDFIKTSAKLKQLYLQGKKFELINVQNYIEKQASSSLKTLLIAHNGDLSKIISIIENAKINDRQRDLLKTNDFKTELEVYSETNFNTLTEDQKAFILKYSKVG